MPFLRCRDLCLPLRAVFPPLQVVLSSACSVASLSRLPDYYLPGHPYLREGALADYPFGRGNPSTWCEGHTAVRDTPSPNLPFGAQRCMTLPKYNWKSKSRSRAAFSALENAKDNSNSTQEGWEQHSKCYPGGCAAPSDVQC